MLVAVVGSRTRIAMVLVLRSIPVNPEARMSVGAERDDRAKRDFEVCGLGLGVEEGCVDLVVDCCLPSNSVASGISQFRFRQSWARVLRVTRTRTGQAAPLERDRRKVTFLPAL